MSGSAAHQHIVQVSITFIGTVGGKSFTAGRSDVGRRFVSQNPRLGLRFDGLLVPCILQVPADVRNRLHHVNLSKFWRFLELV